MVAVSSVRGCSTQCLAHSSSCTSSLLEDAISFTSDRDARTHMKIKRAPKDVQSRRFLRTSFPASSSSYLDKGCRSGQDERSLLRTRIEPSGIYSKASFIYIDLTIFF